MSVINDIATELHNIKTSITTALGNKGITSSGKWSNFKSEIEAIGLTFDTGKVTDMNNMFNNCTSLTTVPEFDTSKVTNMYSMFYNCSSLTTVPAFNTGLVTNMNAMFDNCSSLTTVDMYGMKVSFDLKSCKKLSTEEINKIFNNCGQAVSGAIITLPNTANAKSADNSIATAKGGTIVYA